MPKKPPMKAEAAIEKAENNLAKKLPAKAQKAFAKAQAREKKLERKE